MIFWLIVTVFIIIALLVVLKPYWRKTAKPSPDNSDLNVRLYKLRLAELEADLNNEALDEEQYNQAVSELKLQLLSDVPAEPESRKNAPRRSKQTVIAMVLLVPAVSIGLYALLGNMDIATGKVDITARPGEQEIQNIISSFAEKLESQPDDVNGWVLLGRSYVVIDQIDNAISAYGRAYALAPKNIDVLTGLAEALALANNNQIQGRSMELLQEALEIDQSNPRVLWLAGYAQAQLGNNKQAVKYWKTLLSLLPPDDKEVQMIRQFITQIGGQIDDVEESPVAEGTQDSINPGVQGSGDSDGIR